LNPSTYKNVTNSEAFGKGDRQCATLDEQRRTRLAIERVAEAAESIARSLNRAWYAEHPVGGKPVAPHLRRPVGPWAKPAFDLGWNYAKRCLNVAQESDNYDESSEIHRLATLGFSMRNEALGILDVVMPLTGSKGWKVVNNENPD